MAKMFTIKGKKATQSVYLAHAAYESAKALVLAHNGKIGSDDGKMIIATFESNENAKAFATAFESEYTKAHKAYAKAKGKAEKKPTASTRKPKADAPKKAKGNAFDFGKIKGKTNSDKNKALHAMLVGMGHADSRTPEYQAVWNARPWAK